mmetsp:Transcript_26923/g.70759  ORF Transcript_26923/g.70759 Transcript_26923/m.70759 type:complete len:239 (-) Transcript_26923:152-868(-)
MHVSAKDVPVCSVHALPQNASTDRSNSFQSVADDVVCVPLRNWPQSMSPRPIAVSSATMRRRNASVTPRRSMGTRLSSSGASTAFVSLCGCTFWPCSESAANMPKSSRSRATHASAEAATCRPSSSSSSSSPGASGSSILTGSTGRSPIVCRRSSAALGGGWRVEIALAHSGTALESSGRTKSCRGEPGVCTRRHCRGVPLTLRLCTATVVFPRTSPTAPAAARLYACRTPSASSRVL